MGPKYLDVKGVPFDPNFLNHPISIIYLMKVSKKGSSKNGGVNTKAFPPTNEQKNGLFWRFLTKFFSFLKNWLFWSNARTDSVKKDAKKRIFFSENTPVYVRISMVTEAHKISQALYLSLCFDS